MPIKKSPKIYKTAQNIDMSIEILDCLIRKRDICIKNTIPSQKTAFMWTPALRESFKGHSSCGYRQANRCEENHKFNTSVKITNENSNCMAL